MSYLWCVCVSESKNNKNQIIVKELIEQSQKIGNY